MLPTDLKDFDDRTVTGNNFLRLRYPDRLPGSSYELQFVRNSRTHATHFGYDNPVVLAYYFDKKPLIEQFMTAIKPYHKAIQEQFGWEVKIDYWGENQKRNYVMIGLSLNEKMLGVNPSHYARTIAQFIRSTYPYVVAATRSVSG